MSTETSRRIPVERLREWAATLKDLPTRGKAAASARALAREIEDVIGGGHTFCLCVDAREGTVRYADQSACPVHRMSCDCGSRDASWHGETLRVYCCDACWAKQRVSDGE